MKKPISKNVHGAIDYTYAVVVPMLPQIVNFKAPQAVALCRGLGAGALAYSLLTKARWGLFHVLPFKAHIAIDISVSCLALASPWLLGLGSNTKARNTLLGVGMAGLTAALLTEQAEQPVSACS